MLLVLLLLLLLSGIPLMTRQKLKSNYLNSIRTNPHPLNYLYISGGVSSLHPPKTIFLRRDILLVRYPNFPNFRSFQISDLQV
jgi:hypothetical protein